MLHSSATVFFFQLVKQSDTSNAISIFSQQCQAACEIGAAYGVES